MVQVFCLAQAQKTIFVDANVLGGAMNGASWANAFDNLKIALNTSSANDQIWVAKGTYYPTTSTDRTISFVLRNGVQLYGGFNGTETDLFQRDFTTNETILSGNIGDPVGTDNSYHVLYGSGLDSNTVLDGFVIMQGSATSSDLLYSNGWGGGLLLESSQSIPNTCPKIQNCRFEQNFARVGGAIYCLYDQVNMVNPILRNCEFISNRATTFAGAVYKKGPAMPDDPFVVENCLFSRNAALSSDGGGFFLANTGYTTIFRNCTFDRDSAKFSLGGGLYCAGFENGLNSVHLILDSCLFKNNVAAEGAGFCYLDLTSFDSFLECEILNSRFEGNKSSNAGGSAFYIAGFAKSKFKTDIEKTSFADNLSLSSGTTIVQTGAEGQILAKYKNCSFISNQGIGGPNDISFPVLTGVSPGSVSQVDVSNCLFAKNGGGVAVLNSTQTKGATHITNCTFYRNGRFVIDKNWSDVYVATDSVGHDLYIRNCIFWEPQTNKQQLFTNNDFSNVNMYDYHIDNTLVSLTDYIIPGAPEAYGGQVILGSDPKFEDPLIGNFKLEPCSPAVNYGDNSAANSAGLVFDLDGNNRFYLDTVDLGAYEVQDSCWTVATDEKKLAYTSVLSPNPVEPGGTTRLHL